MTEKRKNAIAVITFIYNLFCWYGIVFCLYHSPSSLIYNFLGEHAEHFTDVFLEITDGTIFFIIRLFFYGFASAITLAILHKKYVVRSIILISSIIFVCIFLLLYFNLEGLLWVLLIPLFLSLIYSDIALCILHSKRNDKIK